jgi:CRP/FNR family transcriptional regulator, cyclic AMP receptor protein
MTLEESLAATTLFGRLNGKQQQRLAKEMTTRRFDSGTVILRQGTSAVALYLILDGEVQISRSPEEGGDAAVLATLGPGDIFGEMALLDDEARSTNVTAVVETTCALLSRWEFQQELRRTPDIAITLLRVLSRRIRELDERVARYEQRRTVV